MFKTTMFSVKYQRTFPKKTRGGVSPIRSFRHLTKEWRENVLFMRNSNRSRMSSLTKTEKKTVKLLSESFA